MSRIEEAFRRVARREVTETAGTKTTSLDRFTFEETPAIVHSSPIPVVNRREPAPVPPASSPAAPAAAPAPPDGPNPDEALVDFRQIGDYIGFVVRSVIRHPYLAALTFILMVGATAGAVALWPRTYHVDARLLAQQGDLMAAYSNPRTSSSSGASPTYAVSETILRRDNLVSLIKQTDLLNEWERTRPAALRLKDRIMRAMRGAPSEEDRLATMIGLLEQRFEISVTMEGAVVIGITWPNARSGYELVEAALQNFLDMRQSGEAATLNDSITVLERYGATLERDVNATFAEYQAEQARRIPVGRRLTLPAVMPTTAEAFPVVPGLPAPPLEVIVRLGRVKAALDAKRAEVARLEESKAQQYSDLEGKLGTALTVYTETHPMVASLRQSLAAVAQDSPQLQQARVEAQNLERDYVTMAAAQEKPEKPPVQQTSVPAADVKGTADSRTGPQASAVRRLPDVSSLRAPRAAANDSPSESTAEPAGPADYASLTAVRLRLQVGQLGDIRDRIAGARLALATSQAGFKYRYVLTRPPQFPRAPIKPNVPLVILAGVLGAFGLAIAAALARDLLSGRIVESWQVERQVGVPVLAHVRHL
jgi:hypothetical protein